MPLPQPGDEFEGYRVEAVLGAGGFATVFRAQRDGRIVALKVLHFGDPRSAGVDLARFRREVAILARLNNPHTVRMLASGESADGQAWVAFEHLTGRDLDEALAAGPMPADAVVAVLRQCLTSLSEAHDLGLIHRDIKPQNIRLVAENGLVPRVKLLDFGIARTTGREAANLTKTGELVGTPRYMSPEQLRGLDLRAASDIYSLGMVAFEMVMGSAALTGNNIFDQIDRMRSGHLFSMPALERANLGLVAVIQRMTALKPEERFQSAAAVLTALNELETGETRQRPRPEPSTLMPSNEPRSLRPLVLTLAVLTLAIGALVFVVKAMTTAPLPEPKVPAALLLPKPAADGPAPRPDPEPVSPPDAGAEPDLVRVEGGSPGCGKKPPFIGAGRIDGMVAFVPRDYDPGQPYPLLILAAGDTHSPADFLRISGFDDVADREGFVIAVPDGRDWTYNGGLRNVLPTAGTTSSRSLCIDSARVFVFGFAKGARAAYRVQCESWVTAGGWASHRLSRGDISAHFPCTTAKPMIAFEPNNSKRVRRAGGEGTGYCGGGDQMSMDEATEFWRTRLHATKATRPQREESALCHSWEGEHDFKTCELAGGYLWPGTQPTPTDQVQCHGETSMNYPIAQRTWEFFQSVPSLPR